MFRNYMMFMHKSILIIILFIIVQLSESNPRRCAKSARKILPADEIEARFEKCVNMLEPGGKFYLRANPGIPHKTGPYVDIFPWSFEIVKEFADKYKLKLETFKKDANDRLYFVYSKLA